MTRAVTRAAGVGLLLNPLTTQQHHLVCLCEQAQAVGASVQRGWAVLDVGLWAGGLAQLLLVPVLHGALRETRQLNLDKISFEVQKANLGS